MRGRLDDPSVVTWTLEPQGGPVDADTLRAAVFSAARAWSRPAEGGTGAVGFRLAADGEVADVVISWHDAGNDPCRLFGRGLSVAHTGPLGPGTFMHLDAQRSWSVDGSDGRLTLAAAIAHEFGHVLGLDHSPDPSALMCPDLRVAVPAPADRDGLCTLYGGGHDAPGDVVIERPADGRPAAPALRGVAPSDCTALALFDADGDGDQELLAWRTDPAGLGALMIHDFESRDVGGVPSPCLVATLGPILDLVPLGAMTSLRRSPDGRRWILMREGDVLRVRGFDERGWLREPEPREQLDLDVDALLASPGPDVLPSTSRTGAALPPSAGSAGNGTDGAPVAELAGDLDGDGSIERVRRLPGDRVSGLHSRLP